VFYKKILKKACFFLTIFLIIATQVLAAPTTPPYKTKFYNFDDLLIDGKITKPKILYIDPKQRAKFDRLLKLKKSFLPNLKNTAKDPSLR